ncbi:MAG: adenylate/guanylate cyclase domain-containing protein [Alphaproteobacteria bacterium]|nr:adenylate/guanylate cyclase domain-containing protein [Alphaproteobacteria bacterium]
MMLLRGLCSAAWGGRTIFRRILKRYKWVHLLALGVLIGVVVLRVADPAALQVFRFKIFDLYQRAEPREITKQPVVIIDIDEESLAEIGQWPWPRTVIAQLITKLIIDYKVPAAALDIVFAEPDRTSPNLIAANVSGLDESLTSALSSLPSNDDVFAHAIKAAGRVVLGQSTTSREVAGEDDRKSVKASIGVRAAKGVDPKNFVFSFSGLVRNLEVLEKAAAGIGVFTFKPSHDGIVRQVPLVMRVGDQFYPALSLELLRVATGQKTIMIKADVAGISSVVMKGFEVPTTRNGEFFLRFAPHTRDRYVSARDVLNGTLPPERLAGHMALIGTSAVGLLDIKATPVDDAMPGVELHAQLLENVLTKSFLTMPNWALGAELIALVIVGLLMIALVPFLGSLYTLLLGMILIFGLLGLSWYMFSSLGLLLDMVYVALVASLIYGVMTYLNYMREERERRQVRGAFSRYMSPALVEQLAQDPTRLKLGGEMRDMTLLFCDIRGFTTISEQFDAAGLTRFINRFLTPMTELILARRGTIDKYMGDCIMAFWNAPLDDPDHAKNGVRSALAMVDGVKALNAQLKSEAETEQRKFVPINIGIGLNSGMVCVGNMGSDMRFDYSVLGDDVNLASRLEGQSKTYGTDNVIGENTRTKIEGFACLQLDRIQVKGKTVPVDIYTCLGDEALAATPEFKSLQERHKEMFTTYRMRDWAAMRRKLAECRALAKDQRLTTLYDLYEERLGSYEAAPPGESWDGVYVAKSK